MDYRRLLGQFYPNKDYFCKDTYESLEWREIEIPKPTKEELYALYENVKYEWSFIDMKEKRNMLLVSSDYRALPDYPNRDIWLVYRQSLRDLPINWTIETPFPEEPTS